MILADVPAPQMRVGIFTSQGTTSTSWNCHNRCSPNYIWRVDDAFLVKFNSSGVRQWGTYYGGTNDDNGYSCATDASGNIYLSGIYYSTSGIATTGAHQTTFRGGSMMPF